MEIIRGTPLGIFVHISTTTQIDFALKKTYVESFLEVEVPTEILNHFWIKVTVLLLKLLYGSFRIETAVTARNT